MWTNYEIQFVNTLTIINMNICTITACPRKKSWLRITIIIIWHGMTDTHYCAPETRIICKCYISLQYMMTTKLMQNKHKTTTAMTTIITKFYLCLCWCDVSIWFVEYITKITNWNIQMNIHGSGHNNNNNKKYNDKVSRVVMKVQFVHEQLNKYRSKLNNHWCIDNK